MEMPEAALIHRSRGFLEDGVRSIDEGNSATAGGHACLRDIWSYGEAGSKMMEIGSSSSLSAGL